MSSVFRRCWRMLRSRSPEKKNSEAGRSLEAEAYFPSQQLAKLTENLPGFIFQYRMSPEGEGNFPYISGRALDFFGLDADALRRSDDSLLKGIDPNHRDRLRLALDHSAKDLSPLLVAFRIRAANGSQRWLQITATPEHADTETYSIQWNGYAHDITARKNAEHALDQQREVRELFAKHAPAAVAMFDRNMCYLVASQRWYDDYHLTDPYITGKCHYDVFPEIPERWREDHRRVLNGEIHKAEADPFERADGSTQWLKYELHPWRTSEGEIGGIVMFTQDITKQKNLEIELAEARDKALEVSRLKSEFLANMSHEIRTPMNGIIGMASMIDELCRDEEAKRMNQVVIKSSSELLRIINDILDFSKVEAGKLEIEPKPFALNQLILDTVKLFAFRAKTLGNQLTTEFLTPSDPLLFGDAGRIGQILNNLISNALKFTEEGSICIRSGIEIPSSGCARVRVEVIDTGIGIPSRMQPRLFESFSQGDGTSTRKYGGTGLGLAISKQLIELMGGTIGVESEEGIGSTFWIELHLPLVKSSATPPKEIQSPDDEGESKVSRPLKILVAEDNADNQLVITTMLKRLHCEVHCVGDGVQTLQELKKSPFDLIFMDCQMPRKDGYQTTREIRAHQGGLWNPEVPIIALTANAFSRDRDRSLEAGMNAHISKPITFKAISECIRNIRSSHPTPSGRIRATVVRLQQKPTSLLRKSEP